MKPITLSEKAEAVKLTIEEIKRLPPEMQREIKGAIRLQKILKEGKGKKSA